MQWRIVRDRPNDFTHRFEDERQFEPNVTTFGWRQSNLTIEPRIVDEYRAIINRYGGTLAFREAAEHAGD